MPMAIPRRLKDLSECPSAEAQKELLFKIFKETLPRLQIFGSDLLVATHIRSNILSSVKTVDGNIVNIRSTDQTSQEDLFQGKASLILAMGPTAFQYDRFNAKWQGPSAKVGDWVMFRFAEAGFDVDICGCYCRFIDSSLVRGVVEDPALVY